MLLFVATFFSFSHTQTYKQTDSKRLCLDLFIHGNGRVSWQRMEADKFMLVRGHCSIYECDRVRLMLSHPLIPPPLPLFHLNPKEVNLLTPIRYGTDGFLCADRRNGFRQLESSFAIGI